VAAQIGLDEASLPHLLGPLVNWGENAGADAGVTVASASSSPYWPEANFDARVLEGFSGRLQLKTERLKLIKGVVLDDAAIEATLADGTLDARSVKGTLLGGAFSGSAKLFKRGSGLGLTAEAEIKDMRLEAATPVHSSPFARGSADLTLDLAGEGLSPRGLAAGLTGNGKLVLGKGSIEGLSPGILAPYDDPRVQASAAQATDRMLAGQVAARLQDSRFTYSAVTVPLAIRNGSVRFTRVALASAEGDATVTTFVDLAGLRLDSEWVLVSGKPAENDVAPQVTLAFAGSLFDFGRLRPAIDAQELERYITIRRMERDVKQLEELDVTPRGARSSLRPLDPVKPQQQPSALKTPPSAGTPAQTAAGEAAASALGNTSAAPPAGTGSQSPPLPLPSGPGPGEQQSNASPSAGSVAAPPAKPPASTPPQRNNAVVSRPPTPQPEVLPWLAQPTPGASTFAPPPRPETRQPRAVQRPWNVEVFRQN
jgi:hypothetical protein